MLVSCPYCKKVHPRNYTCPSRPKYANKKKGTTANKFRASYKWKMKSKEIKTRDKYLCQYCLKVTRIPNTKNLEVHHVISIEQDESKKLDDNNLITLCRSCHEKAEIGLIKASELRNIVPPYES